MAPQPPNARTAPAKPWRSSIRARVVTLVVVLVTTPALAQEPAPPAEPVIRLPEVRISAPARLPEAPLPLDHVPGSVQILTGDAIRESGAVSLQDALTRLPGITAPDE